VEPLVDRIESLLGSDPLGLPVVSEKFRPFEHATVQLAIDQLNGRLTLNHAAVAG
jgi:hypothetical protein